MRVSGVGDAGSKLSAPAPTPPPEGHQDVGSSLGHTHEDLRWYCRAQGKWPPEDLTPPLKHPREQRTWAMRAYGKAPAGHSKPCILETWTQGPERGMNGPRSLTCHSTTPISQECLVTWKSHSGSFLAHQEKKLELEEGEATIGGWGSLRQVSMGTWQAVSGRI